ncbi:VOC family protein [Marimonas arenosa]|uniref:VOC family protein n=1 Tax=Marimonas arenosa TaxID=1795305 RepID=A0AAE3WDR3_9RHOB|nr:VOC family protein [Marimonas arenosa]MDQ2089875.1 VOC family protein [Marimonas arenosa]
MERQGAMAAIEGQITWVYCDDLDTTSAFYADALGLTLWRDAGMARIFRTAPGAFIGVCRAFEDRVVNPAGGMITLLTDDVDGWYDRLKSRGVPLRGAPQEMAEFGIYSFFCEDPNGYVIEVQAFLDT